MLEDFWHPNVERGVAYVTTYNIILPSQAFLRIVSSLEILMEMVDSTIVYCAIMRTYNASETEALVRWLLHGRTWASFSRARDFATCGDFDLVSLSQLLDSDLPTRVFVFCANLGLESGYQRKVSLNDPQ